MRIDFTKNCSKQISKAPTEIQKAFRSRFDIFLSNQYHPLLRNHRLTGEHTGCRSINITGDWRAIYKVIDSITDEDAILFIALGTHSQLYQ